MVLKSPYSPSADPEGGWLRRVIKAEEMLRSPYIKAPPSFAMVMGIKDESPIVVQLDPKAIIKPVEREADRQRDEKSVWVSKIPLRASHVDVFRFFSSVCEVRDFELDVDLSMRCRKAVLYIEFVHQKHVPMAIDLSGQLLLGEPIEIKPLNAGNHSTGEICHAHKNNCLDKPWHLLTSAEQLDKSKQKMRSAAQDDVFYSRRMTRSTIKCQQLDDYFSNRRMTRSEFRQIFSEGKIQKKGSEGYFSNWRIICEAFKKHQYGKRKERKKRKPLAYNVGSFTEKNQLPEERKERPEGHDSNWLMTFSSNYRQRHGKVKAFSTFRMPQHGDKISCSPVTPHYPSQHGEKKQLKEDNKFQPFFMGSFTQKEHDTYNKVVVETNGFGSLYVPPGVSVPGILISRPLGNMGDEAIKFLNDMAEVAVRHYNSRDLARTQYKFAKIIRVNTRWNGRSFYNITYQAKDDMAGSPPKNFQACLSESFGCPPVVLFCRVEQEPRPIDPDRLELNVAGCAKGNPGRGGFGGLLRTERGSFCNIAFYGRLEPCTSLEAELRGVCRGLEIMLYNGYHKFEVQTVSETVRDLILDGAPRQHPWCNLVEDARAILARCQASIYCIRREANRCADFLANMGAVQDDELKVMTVPLEIPEPVLVRCPSSGP